MGGVVIMTCPQYILTDDEITTVCANFLLLDNITVDLKVLIGQLPVVNDTIRDKVKAEIARMDVALNNLRPLVTHLFELQGGGKTDER